MESVINDVVFAALKKQSAFQLFDRNNFVRWDVAKLGEFNSANFSRIGFETFVQLGRKATLPDYCQPVVNFPGYKPALAKAQEWADFFSELA